ncbi:MAG: hypothetical protein ACFFFT_05485 [Candidatus Thorarchaeota archaeon]
MMDFNYLIIDYENNYENGRFVLKKEESINVVLKRENIPYKYGFYLIYGVKGKKIELIYIGKAGTIQQNGVFKKQKLRKRLRMKQDKVPRRVFFQDVIRENKYDHLLFRWFIINEKEIIDLPAFIEANLINKFYKKYKKLPKLNKSF